MSLAGTRYVSSGKFEAGRTIGATLLGCAGAACVGMLYGVISEVNPFIYLNFLVLLGAVLVLGIFAIAIRRFGRSRNSLVNILLTVAMCYTAWHAQWAFYAASNDYVHGIELLNPIGIISFIFQFAENRNISVGHFGSDGLPISGGLLLIVYLVELLVFMMPVYMVAKDRDYYCEDCNRFYNSFDFWLSDVNRFNEYFTKTKDGDYEFLKNFNLVPSHLHLGVDPALGQEIIKISHHFCAGCMKNDIMDMTIYVLKYDSKRQVELASEKMFKRGIYITALTKAMMSGRLRDRLTDGKKEVTEA